MSQKISQSDARWLSALSAWFKRYGRNHSFLAVLWPRMDGIKVKRKAEKDAEYERAVEAAKKQRDADDD